MYKSLPQCNFASLSFALYRPLEVIVSLLNTLLFMLVMVQVTLQTLLQFSMNLLRILNKYLQSL